MDFFDALHDIHKKHPDLPEDEIRAALEEEVSFEDERLRKNGMRDTRGNRYAAAVDTAHNRVLDWLANGHETTTFTVVSVERCGDDHIDGLCKAMMSHRRGWLWATIRSMQANAKTEGWPL